jgi:calcineurin-like phosphoesterase family protein
MSEVWFTSDTHFGHARVIEYSNRPFPSVEEMDEAMILNWNAMVRPGDRVYHLGDFSFHRPERSVAIARRLMGQKYLVLGNHDKRLRNEPDFLSHWIWARDLEGIAVADQRIVLCHYAMLTWNQSHRGAWMLHGHSHGSLPRDSHSLRMDVGVDPMGYQPVSFETVRDEMASRDFRPIDHHGEREHD